MPPRRDDPPTDVAVPAVALGATLAAARAGDADAFATLYRRFVAASCSGIALAGVGPSDADDVVQDAFVAVHRGLASVRDPAALPGWICVVARHATADRARRQGP